MDAAEQPFEDGNITAVVRVGDTVRRATGSWTPAVHALLRHLEARGFDGAPRALGFDDAGREVLSDIAGRTAPASLDGIRSDDVLAATARLVRRYHDAVADFVEVTGDDPSRWSKVAPPGFAAAALFSVAPALLDELYDHSIVHGEQVFTWSGPIAIGDLLSVKKIAAA